MLKLEVKRMKPSKLLPEEVEVLETEESNVEDIEHKNITESEDSHNDSDLAEPSLVDVLEALDISNFFFINFR